MGRQINFFMHPDDETSFCQFVLSEPGAMIVLERVDSLPPLEHKPKLPPVDPNSMERHLLLWNTAICGALHYTKNTSGIYCSAGSHKGGIEFTRSAIDGDVVRAGRLWTEPAFFLNLAGEVADPPKKRAYDRWVNSLFRWIRKHYVKHSRMFYTGPAACRFQEMGGRVGPMYAEMENPDNIEKRFF